MNAVELITDLRGAGVVVEAVGGRLRLDGPGAVLTPELLGLVQTVKADIIAMLTVTPVVKAVPPFNPELHIHNPDPDDAADVAVLAWLDAGRPMPRPDPPAAQFGGPFGWSVSSWVGRLRQLAATCEAIRPDLAMVHRAEADRIEHAAGQFTRGA